MESTIKQLLEMNYKEVVQVLIQKYGQPKKSYFHNNKYWNSNSSNSRTKEGLIIHHIDEDKAIMLSDKDFAKLKPWGFQLPDRLVYCNLLEHLVLHIKIMEYGHSIKHNNVGIGGVINFIIPQLNDMYSGIKYKPYKDKTSHYLTNLAKIILPMKNDYFLSLKKILNGDELIEHYIDENYLFNPKPHGNSKEYKKLLKKWTQINLLKDAIYENKKAVIFGRYFKQSYEDHQPNSTWVIKNNEKFFEEIFEKVIKV